MSFKTKMLSNIDLKLKNLQRGRFLVNVTAITILKKNTMIIAVRVTTAAERRTRKLLMATKRSFQ